MKLVLSTVGTSLLTNQVEGEQRKELIMSSNLREKEYSSELIGLIEYTRERLSRKISSATIAEIKRLSAELNGILGIYNGEFSKNNQDTHVLIATDTYQGKITAEIISGFLKEKGISNVIIYAPLKLRTVNRKDFTEGMKNLLRWLDEELSIESYRSNRYEVIFNLTGGFKSLQGYLNTVGMFYADRIVYIFESGEEVIEIPKLPVKIPIELFDSNASEFLLMANDCPRSCEGIPDIMLEEYDKGVFILSEWGMLSWNKVKSDVLSKRLVDMPSLDYDDSFKRDFEDATPSERVKLQETLGKVSAILQQGADGVSKLKQDGGLQYDNYSGKNNGIGHFRIDSGRRVSCTASGKTLRLRHFGEHDFVNNNP